MHEALVHNGDFANYYSVTEYLDSETSSLCSSPTRRFPYRFRPLEQGLQVPLEYVIEGLAPTVERDFDMLRRIRRKSTGEFRPATFTARRTARGFLSSRGMTSRTTHSSYWGITDTAMLRPQVFALQDGEVQIGLICSEKQAIDATLASLAAEDNRFCPIADEYWNARGGSYTDGGTFIFTVKKNGAGYKLPAPTSSATREGQAGKRIEDRGLRIFRPGSDPYAFGPVRPCAL